MTNAVFYFNGRSGSVRVKLTTPEAKRLFRDGRGRELEVEGNGLCQDLSILEALLLSGRSPLDLRRAFGAWMLLNSTRSCPET